MQSVAVLQHLRQLQLQSDQMNEEQAAAQQRATQGQAGQLDPTVEAGQQQQQQQQQQQMPNLDANHHQGLGLQPNNPGAGFLAAMWPHVWLLTRLVLFVWWFTNPDASWTRWIMVILIATAVFIYNTGVLDGLADQIWTPIRAHLDGLVNPQNTNGQAGAQNEADAQNAAVPTGEANAAVDRAGDVPPAPPPIGRAGGRDPDPAEVAARLVAQRQINNGQRLRDFAQRLERIGVMFLASLAPGIAERHVALAEEREREERRRAQEAAEAAIAAAAEAQAQAEAAAAAAATAVEEGVKNTSDENAETGQGAQEVEPSLEDETAAVDAQWQIEQQQQVERDAVAGVQ
ncbi:hypothetical protein HMPREF1624_00606 [Sporothrix schenckii ATCC 58251]|uniref:Uncharacterized protein n=2 Tax=Sporothrix schenckii TaxID=29908 RepID=U7Q371_SPOS1|nr:hypothetical protein HMPREF1624_00606 [Sporothrix schenckii ATCC 58251]